MNYRKIGKTGVEVSEISFGCWTMGGPNWAKGSPIGWGDVNEDEVTAAIKVGLDAGVNHFDNADVYGNGRAERMLARSLDRLGVKSGKLVVATITNESIHELGLTEGKRACALIKASHVILAVGN